MDKRKKPVPAVNPANVIKNPANDWEAVEEIGRRLYQISLPGVPVDPEELAALASALVLLANVKGRESK